jgi:hypothetical protein
MLHRTSERGGFFGGKYVAENGHNMKCQIRLIQNINGTSTLLDFAKAEMVR